MNREARAVIADDEAPARQLIREYLGDFPRIEVVAECADGEEAVRAINTERPDLAFLDVRMPGRSGFDVLTEVERIALLKQPNRRAPTGLRNLCMIRLMLNAGLRSSEVLNLKIRNLDWMSGRLAVRQGKGSKDRILWISEDDLELLKTCIQPPDLNAIYTEDLGFQTWEL